MKNIALIGLMGAGKSTVGTLLAEKLNLNFVDIDEEIEKSQNKTIAEIFSQQGEAVFREIENQAIKSFAPTSNSIISTGGGALEKEENLNMLKQTCILIYLKASPESLFERIKDDIKRPLLQTPNPLETLKLLLKKRENNYLKADIIIETENKTAAEIVNEIIKKC